jgi:hypothetical protein
LDAVRREIHFREESETRPRVTPEDIRIHAWLNERLVMLHHQRYGFWRRVKRFLSRNRLVRWLRG